MRRMASVGRAFVDGWGRVGRAPALLAGVWVSTIAVALPFAAALHGQMAGHLGESLAAEAAATGVNFDWWNEFLAAEAGIARTFVPAVLGFAAVLKNLSDVADARGVPGAVASAVVVQVALAIFLAGGVLDRLARDRAVGAGAFFHACGVWFFRFLRLAVLAGACYALLFGVLHPWLFGPVWDRLLVDLTVERTAFLYRVLLYAAFAAPLLAVNLVFDYAKARAVVEDRRSAIGALVAGARFAWRHRGQTTALYALNTLVFLAVAAGYAAAAPGASAGLSAFAIGQLYIVLRVALRLAFAASQVSFFQSRLAHAGYVARPVPRWPDSPAADVLRP